MLTYAEGSLRELTEAFSDNQTVLHSTIFTLVPEVFSVSWLFVIFQILMQLVLRTLSILIQVSSSRSQAFLSYSLHFLLCDQATPLSYQPVLGMFISLPYLKLDNSQRVPRSPQLSSVVWQLFFLYIPRISAPGSGWMLSWLFCYPLQTINTPFSGSSLSFEVDFSDLSQLWYCSHSLMIEDLSYKFQFSPVDTLSKISIFMWMSCPKPWPLSFLMSLSVVTIFFTSLYPYTSLSQTGSLSLSIPETIPLLKS